MKRVLIISPNFPPVNAADMHRVRMSLPYFFQFKWQPTILCIDPQLNDIPHDSLLEESIPSDIKVVKTDLLPAIGPLKGMALRAIWQLFRKGAQLLATEKYDLVYFSTTSFPVPVLGYYWKKRFGIPYVIDMQDPWHSEYYRDKPQSERPKNHWFSYRLHRYTEPLAMRSVSGLISVSPAYITLLQERYSRLKGVPARVIPFSASKKDLDIAMNHKDQFRLLFDATKYRQLVYVGRGGHDMRHALHILFSVFKRGLVEDPALFDQFRMNFIGTDYASQERARRTIQPVADELGIGEYVTEITDRIPYYQTLTHLSAAAGLIIPGSDDSGYTASKIYPYLLVEKPLFGIFHPQSTVLDILANYRKNAAVGFQLHPDKIYELFRTFLVSCLPQNPHQENLKPLWEARDMTSEQVELFDQVV